MKTLTEVIATFPTKVLNKYDFSKAVYTSALKPITGIICPEHGEFQQYSGSLRKGMACPECGNQQRVNSLRMPVAEFYKKVSEVHKGFYTYPEKTYTNMTTKIAVECPLHGTYTITPLKHYYSRQGCPVCGTEKRGKRKTPVNVGALAAKTSIKKHALILTERAQAIHGNAYDYSKVDYTGAKNKITIMCKTHGEFQQTPDKHIYAAQGCPHCGQKSKGEEAVAKFLSLFTTVQRRDRSIVTPKELDIVLPEHNIAIEFCGAYYHSHGDVEDERKNKTRHFDKYSDVQNAGYRLITIFDYEWEQRQKVIKRLLRTAIGKSKGKVMARKCELSKVSLQDAKAFYEKYHPQGGSGSGEHYGLFWKNKLVACMRFTYGANDRGTAHQREWTLTRYSTRINVVGGASKLFNAFLKNVNPESVKSFSDNRYFTGGMYGKLGFTLVEENPPDYQVWSNKLGVRPKSHYQRRKINHRLIDHNINDVYNHEVDNRTEQEMTYLMGCRRLYDCGKKKWVYKHHV